ncbi:MAG: AI-2E family transporter [Pseudomonadota bacterium]
MTTAAETAMPAPPKLIRVGGAGRVFFNLGAAILIVTAAYFARGVLIPLVVAGFTCFLIFTLKQTIKATPFIGRFFPAWLSYALAFTLIVTVTIFFVEIIRDNAEALIAAWPQYEDRLRDLTGRGVAYLQGLGALPPDLVDGVDELRSAGLAVINPILREFGAAMRSLTANSVAIFLYTVFMLIERGRFFKKIQKLSASEEQRAVVNETISDIATMVRQYITMKTSTNLVTATVSYIIMRVLGVDFAGFWALLIFVLNFIPIVGAVSAITLPVLLALVQPDGGGFRLAALTLGLLVGAEQTMSSVIEPRLMGRSLNLSPLIILLSLAVWGTVWGFAGALLAVPMTVTVMIILTQFEATRPIAIMMSDNGDIAAIRHGNSSKTTG